MFSEYFVRIELHQATSDNYEFLHQQLQDIGFYRTIYPPGAGIIFPKMTLPTGSYRGWSSLENSGLLIKLRLIAAGTGRKCKIFMAEVKSSEIYFDAF